MKKSIRETGVIEKVEGPFSDNLMMIGFVPGAKMSIVHRCPFGGPVVCHLKGAVVVLRKSEMDCIKWK